MSGYTDVYVLPVPTARLQDYRKVAEISAQVWLDAGARTYVEVVADDVSPGQWTSFPRSVALEPDEIVIVAIVTYRSRAHRDEVNAKAFTDPRLADMSPQTLPFDGKRMIIGGFAPFIDAGAAIGVGAGSAHSPGAGSAHSPGAGSAPRRHVDPYLFFRGRCEEAIRYYQATLGAEIMMMLRFKDNPEKPPHDKAPAAMDERIMHACLRIAGADLMMSDGMRTGPLDFDCMSLSLTIETEAEADRLFSALAQEGKVEMPMGPTFFARRFGAVVDPFGVSWMIQVPHAA